MVKGMVKGMVKDKGKGKGMGSWVCWSVVPLLVAALHPCAVSLSVCVTEAGMTRKGKPIAVEPSTMYVCAYVRCSTVYVCRYGVLL